MHKTKFPSCGYKETYSTTPTSTYLHGTKVTVKHFAYIWVAWMGHTLSKICTIPQSQVEKNQVPG